MGDLHFLETAVGLVLGFIGSKMILEYIGYEIPTTTSLCTVAALLGGGVVLSYILPAPSKGSDD
jgi:predicted tellurium resistance membrane protein TerC